MSFARSFWARGRTATHSLSTAPAIWVFAHCKLCFVFCCLLFWFSMLVIRVADSSASAIWYLRGHTSADLGIQPSTWCKTSSSLKDFWHFLTSRSLDHLDPWILIIHDYPDFSGHWRVYSSAEYLGDVKFGTSHFGSVQAWMNMMKHDEAIYDESIWRYRTACKKFAISLVLTWTCDLSVLDLEANVSRKCDMVATLLSAYKWCGNSWFQILLSSQTLVTVEPAVTGFESEDMVSGAGLVTSTAYGTYRILFSLLQLLASINFNVSIRLHHCAPLWTSGAGHLCRQRWLADPHFSLPEQLIAFNGRTVQWCW